MDGREFVTMVKRYAVDGAVEDVISALKAPRRPNASQQVAVPRNPVEQAIADWIDGADRERQERSKWFNSLDDKDRSMIEALFKECAERTTSYLFTVLDGVGGPFEGVFEVVAIDSDEKRHLVNPENTEMLHDLFSAVCEGDRRQQAG